MGSIDYDKELNGAIKRRSEDRSLLALKLRRDGLTYRAVGEQLDVGASQAASLARHGLRVEHYRKAKP